MVSFCQPLEPESPTGVMYILKVILWGWLVPMPKGRGDPCEVWFIFNEEDDPLKEYDNPKPQESCFTPY